MLLDLVCCLPPRSPPIPHDRLTITQSMLWFVLSGSYSREDLLGGRKIRAYLYALKNALDNYLQFVPGGPCSCRLMRNAYYNRYSYQPDHEDGGLPWVYNIVVRIALSDWMARDIRAVLVRPGRFDEAAHFRENAIEDLVEVWNRQDVQWEFAVLRTRWAGYIRGEMEVVEARFRESIVWPPLDAALLPDGRVSPLLRASLLVQDLGSVYDLPGSGTPLSLGPRSEWTDRLSTLLASAREEETKKVQKTNTPEDLSKHEDLQDKSENLESVKDQDSQANNDMDENCKDEDHQPADVSKLSWADLMEGLLGEETDGQDNPTEEQALEQPEPQGQPNHHNFDAMLELGRRLRHGTKHDFEREWARLGYPYIGDG